MVEPHARRVSSGAELQRLLRDWEACGCASAVSRLFVFFAAGHPWGVRATLSQQRPSLRNILSTRRPQTMRWKRPSGIDYRVNAPRRWRRPRRSCCRASPLLAASSR